VRVGFASQFVQWAQEKTHNEDDQKKIAEVLGDNE
jgi:hypothetical protein